jgi:quercetin dioxygenase-like cupin family protein
MGCGVTQKAEYYGIEAGINVLDDVSQDHTGAGVSAKIVLLKAGVNVIQHKHDYPHLSILLSGKVFVRTDEENFWMDAKEKPVSRIIPAGMFHDVLALTDSEWLCIHLEGKQ